MASKKKFVADLLFGVQIIGAFVLCGTQFFRLLETTKGQLVSNFLAIEVYLVLHLALATAAHRAAPSRITRQTLATYALWLVLIGADLAAIFLNGSYEWSRNDTRTSVLAVCGTALVFMVVWVRGAGLQDPMSKSLLAMIFKALPQFVVAFEVARVGGAGIPAAAIVTGNITILIRIGQIGLAIREAGWDRNRIWLGASEIVNELSWATVSVVWAVWFFSK